MLKTYLNCRQTAGLFAFTQGTSWATLTLSGPDSSLFLQNLCTQDVLNWNQTDCKWAALLDRKAKILSTFLVQNTFDPLGELRLWGEVSSIKVAYELLEKMHFSEEVSFTLNVSEVYTLQGALSLEVFDARYKDPSLMICKAQLCGEEGVLFQFTESNSHLAPAFLEQLCEASFGIPAFKAEWNIFESMRIEAGLPNFNTDLADVLFSETHLHHLFVNAQKGCYPGQEIVARIASRGQTAKTLLGLEWLDLTELEVPLVGGQSLNLPDQKTVRVASSVFHPQAKRVYSLAYASSDLIDGDILSLEVGTSVRKAVVKELPFWTSPQKQKLSAEYYDQGMACFHSNDFALAEVHLRKSIDLWLRASDSYEALGVLLERMNRLDEAIAVHKKQAEMDRHSVMAHANLSRLYAQKGWIEKAEEEQALATQKHFELSARGRTDAKSQDILAANNAKMKADKERKKGIFLQVLQMDPDDDVALFGLGKIHLDSKEEREALPYLEHLLSVQPEYSAAWPLMAKCYYKLGLESKAQEALLRGKEVCEKNRDLMPLKLLQALEREWKRK